MSAWTIALFDRLRWQRMIISIMITTEAPAAASAATDNDYNDHDAKNGD